MSYVYDIVTKREAGRVFLEETLDRRIIDRIITSIKYAPGKNNIFPWKIRLLNYSENKEKFDVLANTFGFLKDLNDKSFKEKEVLWSFRCPTLICFMRNPKAYAHVDNIDDLIKTRNTWLFGECDVDIMVAATFGYITAIDEGLNPNFIRCFNPIKVQEFLDLPLEPVVFVALGRKDPTAVITPLPHRNDIEI